MGEYVESAHVWKEVFYGYAGKKRRSMADRIVAVD
jgi:hypothetical protein